MSRTIRMIDVKIIKEAEEKIRDARQLLQLAGARRAAGYVQRALKSVGGARRHAEGFVIRQGA